MPRIYNLILASALFFVSSTITSAVSPSDINDSQPNLPPFSCPSTNRQRPQISNNTLLADNGYLLRGEHIIGLGVGHHGDTAFLDDIQTQYRLNTIRFIAYRDIRNWPQNWRNLNQLTQIMDAYVNQAAQRGMYIIIDYHPTWGSGDTDIFGIFRQNSLDFWTHIAPRYRDCPHVIYEIWNEFADPTYAVSRSVLQDHQNALYQTTRSKAPQTPIILWSHPHTDENFSEMPNTPPYPNSTKALLGYHAYSMDENFSTASVVNTSPISQAKNQAPIIMTEWMPFWPREPQTCAEITNYRQVVNNVIKWHEDNKVSWVMLHLRGIFEYQSNWDANNMQCQLPFAFTPFWPQDPKVGSQPNLPTNTPEANQWNFNSDNIVNLFDFPFFIQYFNLSDFGFPDLTSFISSL